jgi:hypothetical protein
VLILVSASEASSIPFEAGQMQSRQMAASRVRVPQIAKYDQVAHASLAIAQQLTSPFCLQKPKKAQSKNTKYFNDINGTASQPNEDLGSGSAEQACDFIARDSQL